MTRWILVAVLGLVAVLAVGVNLKPASAEDQEKPGEGQKDDQPKREVDLKLIADPSHKDMNQTAPEKYQVLFHTTAGDFTVDVTRSWAPNGADRFYSLVKNGYYDGNRFFRVVPGFVVQWGLHGSKDVNLAWMDPKNEKAANIKDDPVKESNTRGRITFANAGPDTRSTQLFINLGNNDRLDDPAKMRGAVFAPFGEVTGEGMKIVDKLYNGYGEPPANLQGAIIENGNAILDEYFPKLDGIITATIVEKQAAAEEATEKPAE